MGNIINSIKLKNGESYQLASEVSRLLNRPSDNDDVLVSRLVTDESTGGCIFIPQDIDNGIYLNDYQFYIESKEGIKITGITSANWDRGGLDSSDSLHIGQDNYQDVSLEDLCSKANTIVTSTKSDGTNVYGKSNWKNCPDWNGEGYLCVLDQCSGAKRIKIEIPEGLEFDYFIVTGCGHNNGKTALTPCNPSVLACEDDVNGVFPKNAMKDGIGYVTHKYVVIGNQRNEYYLYCDPAKKIWAQIEFYKYADDLNPYVDAAYYLRTDTGFPVTTYIEEYASLEEQGVPDFSALTMLNSTTFIAASDNQGLGEAELASNSGIYELGLDGKGNLKKVTDWDIEGLTVSSTAVYACVEYDTCAPTAYTFNGKSAPDYAYWTGTSYSYYTGNMSQNDVLKMDIKDGVVDYDSLTKVNANPLITLCGDAVSANQGFEGLVYYKTTDEYGDLLFLGNQNPMYVALYSVKQDKIINEQKLDFSSEIADMAWGFGYLWVIDSLTGDFFAASVDDNTYKITMVKNFHMIFSSGGNENCESITIDETNKCAWIGTEVGQRLYKVTLPTKEVDGKTVLDI